MWVLKDFFSQTQLRFNVNFDVVIFIKLNEFNCLFTINCLFMKVFRTGPVGFQGYLTSNVINFSIVWMSHQIPRIKLRNTKAISKENQYFNFGSERAKDNSVPIWLWFLCFFWRSRFLRSLPRTLAQFDFYKIYHWETKLQWYLFDLLNIYFKQLLFVLV